MGERKIARLDPREVAGAEPKVSERGKKRKLRWWCASSTFGTSRNNDWSAETQLNVLPKALDALGIRQ